ncbi:MAG: DUF3854 domain-containing protein [Bacteroidales bacterium]|nr:DUF3854 domain-containing protein [Bacteroidales bacterium]
MIYEFITSNAKLSEHHRTELKQKRGFTDQTIDDNRFISGGKYLLDLEEKIISAHNDVDLLSSGVCLKEAGALHLSPVLLEDRILIPYLDKNSKAYHLRPHKLGFKDVEIQIYHEKTIGREIILTEGEFKAAAAVQYGFNAIAVPGISSFADRHFPRLLKFLNNNKVREIAIMFDNEVKDDPAFKSYKDDPNKRYDVYYYAYYMAYMLDKEGFECRVAWLPDGWRVNGKIDIDGALACGKTSEELRSIISKSKTPRIFFDELPKQVRQLIKRKLKKRYLKSHVRKEFGKYVATRMRNRAEVDEIISNFTIKIIATHETIEGIIREVIFINEFDETTPSFSLSPESMTGSDSFSTFCLAHGNYIWRGNREDLASIWESEFLDDDGRHIIEPDHIGWIPAEKMWLFGNVAIKANGEELRPDKNHIFWTEKKGLKPIPLGITSGRAMISEGIPYLNLAAFDTEEVRRRLVDTIGEMEANICLGWVTSVCFLEEVFASYGCFPFMFITGRRGSGKSTIAEWMINFFGVENAGKMASDTTAVAIQRYLAYYSSLPMFIDEYRNTKQITYKNGFFRNAYNRQSAGKGIKSDFGIREAKIRGTLIISGEETPEDNAFLTRCIVVVVSKKHRKENHFNWFTTQRMKFSGHILQILRHKKKLLPEFMEYLHTAKEYYTDVAGVDDRTAINYAIVAAGNRTAFGSNIDFEKLLTHESKRVESEYQQEQAISTFLEDLLVFQSLGRISDTLYDFKDGIIYLYFHGLYTIWSQEYRKTRGIEPFKSSAIRDYLKEEPGYIDGRETVRIKGHLRKCVTFDYSNAPDEIRQLVDNGNMVTHGNNAVTEEI